MKISATGPVPADEAWERYAVPARWAEWAPQITSVSCAADRLGPGVRGVVHGWGPVRVPFEVLAVDEAARRWTWRVAGLVRMTHGVDPHPTGTTAWVDLPAWLPAYAPVARWALGRLVR